MVGVTPAGDRDKRVTFQRGTAAPGAFRNEPLTVWTDIGPVPKRWAKVLYGTGAERRQAATEAASQTATVRTLQDALTRTITTADRIVFDGRPWDVTAIAPIGRADIEFTCIAKGK